LPPAASTAARAPFGCQQAVQRDFTFDFAGHDDLRRQRVDRHDARVFQHQDIDRIRLQSVQIRQAHFGGVAARRRIEAALGQPALQGHLAALEADFVITAGARALALVAASRRLAESAADAAADAAFRVLGAVGGFDRVELHLNYPSHFTR
jgi:hypothetical protein